MNTAARISYETGFAAIFIDFENIFYFLKNHYQDPPELENYAFEMLRNLKEMLAEKHNLQSIIMKSYADFERLGTPAQGSLYLMGIDTHNVLGTEHKNAADMRLCIDALEVLYTRPEIQSFIFVAGDRDYIPVIQNLKKQARHVYASAFRENVSGDLLLNIGKSYFIDAKELLTAETLEKLEKRKADYERQKQAQELLKAKGMPAFEKFLNGDGAAAEAENSQLAVATASVAAQMQKQKFYGAPVKAKPQYSTFDEEDDTPATFEKIKDITDEERLSAWILS